MRPEPVAPNPPPWRPVAHSSPPPWPPLVDPDAAALEPPSQTPTPPGPAVPLQSFTPVGPEAALEEFDSSDATVEPLARPEPPARNELSASNTPLVRPEPPRAAPTRVDSPGVQPKFRHEPLVRPEPDRSSERFSPPPIARHEPPGRPELARRGDPDFQPAANDGATASPVARQIERRRWSRIGAKVVLPPPGVAPPGAFEQLRRAAKRAAAVPQRTSFANAVRRHARPAMAAAASVAVAVALWAWWSSARVEEPSPLASESRAVGLLPFMPSWADLRASGTTPSATATTGPAGTAPAPRDPSAVTPALPPAAPLPVPAAAPSAVAPTVSAPAPSTASPAATAGSRVPPPPADTAPRSTGGSAGLGATTPGASEPLYSWSSRGVQPPVLRYPAMASWAMLGPDAVIDRALLRGPRRSRRQRRDGQDSWPDRAR